MFRFPKISIPVKYVYVLVPVCMQAIGFKKIKRQLMFPKFWPTLKARLIAYGYYWSILLGYSVSCIVIKLSIFVL